MDREGAAQFLPKRRRNLPSADLILTLGLRYNWPFELIRDNGGDWGVDTMHPNAGPIFDPSGNLYGTVLDAAAFELIPNHGKWTEKVLYSFTGKHDGYFYVFGDFRHSKPVRDDPGRRHLRLRYCF